MKRLTRCKGECELTRQIILDTETTGISPTQGHRIIELGCIEMQNRQFTGNNLHLYFKPERDIDAGAIRVHGLTNQFLSDKPLFATQIETIIEYLRGAELIIHNAPFDVGFLNHEFRLAGRKYQQLDAYCQVLDTLAMARNKHPGQRNSLDALCQRYAIDNSSRQFHGALLDSQLLGQVYLRMTGGQTQLFADQDGGANEVANDVKRLAQDRQPLPVIEPTAQELQAHQAYLTALREKNDGQCVWDRVKS
jgi:DNA polymerase III subunit epsilon